MNLGRFTTGFFFLVALAMLGFLLVYIPPQIVQHYRMFSEQEPLWGQIYLAVVGTGALLMLGATATILVKLWIHSRRKRRRRERLLKNPSQLSSSEIEQELAENLDAVERLRGEVSLSPEVRRELDDLQMRLAEKQNRQRLEIVAFGSISSGKSSLLNVLAGRDVFSTDARGGTTVHRSEVPWPGADQVVLVDTPGLGEIDGAEHVNVSAAAAKDADLVLVVVDGPLRDYEFALLRRLGEMEKRILVCLNKSDWYGTENLARLKAQIVEQLRSIVAEEDVVAVAAQPVERRRVRVLPDGREEEETVTVPPNIERLAERMLQVVRKDGRDLLLANLLLQSRGLVEQARERVQAGLDQRAWQIVDKYMWGAGGAAALSPLPLVDLAAGGAISVKMVLDLAKVYRQDVDFDVAVQLVSQLGKNLVAILGVSLATPAVVAAIASLLKTIPGAGTIAGGLLQGIVQALVTRWIGGVFIRHFKNEMQADQQGLAALARDEWQRVTSVAELRKLVAAAREHFTAGDRQGDSR